MDRLRKSIEFQKCFLECRERTPEYLMEKMGLRRHTLYRIVAMLRPTSTCPSRSTRKRRCGG